MSFREARKAAGKKIPEVIAHMGVTDSAIYQWECGMTAPKVKDLPKLAAFYGCTVDTLLYGNPVYKKKG